MKMKTIIKKYISNIIFMSCLILITLVLFSTETDAQFRRGFGGHSFTHIPHYSVRYYGVRHGLYFRPRIGARFTVLPYGYTTFWIGGFPYYYYDGFWFEYFPAYGYYAVVNKPAEVTNTQNQEQNQKFDKITFKDGSTVEGIFEGSSGNTITLKVGNVDQNYDINQISSISFAPAIQDTTQTQ
jgi:hypothetical protein